MTELFIAACIQAVFFSFLLFTKKNRSLADKILATWLIVLGIHLFGAYHFQQGTHLKYFILLGIGPTLTYLHGPLFWLYIRTLTSRCQRFKLHYLWHFLPFVAYHIILIPFHIKTSAQKTQVYRDQLSLVPDWIAPALSWFSVLTGPFYLLWIGVLLWQHRQNLSQYFSFTEQINLSWIWFLIGSNIAIWTVVIIMHFLPYELNTDLYIFSTISLFIFGLGYFGYRQQAIFQQEPPKVASNPQNNLVNMVEEEAKTPTTEEENKYRKSGLKKDQAQIYLAQLEQLMQQEKPYLEPKLTLAQLAQQSNVPSHYLTEILNTYLDQSFFDYINLYRVNTLKERMLNAQYQQYTLLAIALDCGFNSKSSFNRIFKKVTGLTPTQYQKNQQN